MRKKSKKMVVMSMILGLGVILQVNTAEAALQSNPTGTPITANLNDWVYYTRQMQATGGTLGLTDSISDTDLTSSNKNLDIHMQKNTEYGAVAILSASAYGNPEKIEAGGTTTGNSSGIVVRLSGEWVAAGINNTQVGNMKKAAARYWNNYGTGNGSNGKSGDALGETNGWHGSSGNSWLRHVCVNNDIIGPDGGFNRGLNGSVFGFYGLAYEGYWDGKAGLLECGVHSTFRGHGSRKSGNVWSTFPGRACVVVGTGI
jgi:hypothetical protein